MRITVREELDGPSRKTTPKKVRASFRYLIARAAELADCELAGWVPQFDIALDSIWRIRSRVTPWARPISSSVWACRQ